MMRAIESEYLAAVPRFPRSGRASADSLDKKVRLLANGIVTLIAKCERLQAFRLADGGP